MANNVTVEFGKPYGKTATGGKSQETDRYRASEHTLAGG